jgi:S-DNA-T family DNA segregation ATPase FtsK/SpoIIIE
MTRTPRLGGVRPLETDHRVVAVRRVTRRTAPSLPVGDVVLPAPPAIPVAAGSRWTQSLMAVPMLLGTVATAMMFAGRQGGAYSYVVGGVFGVSSLGMLATSFGGSTRQKRADMAAARTDYLRQLGVIRKHVRQNAAQQRIGLYYRHPAPDVLWSLVDSFRIWERRPGDGDFGVVRIGSGAQSPASPLAPPLTGLADDLEPVSAAALRQFLDAYSLVPDLPVAIALGSFTRVLVPAAAGRGRALVRALIAQLTVFHAPDDVIVAACVARDRRPEWDYLKWLPHAQDPLRTDAVGPLRLVTERLTDLEGLLSRHIVGRPKHAAAAAPSRPLARGGIDSPGPLVVVILDGGDRAGATHLLTPDGLMGVCVIDVGAAAPVELAAHETALAIAPGDRLRAGSEAVDGTPDGDHPASTADQLSPAGADSLARLLAPLRLVADGTGTDRSATGTPPPAIRDFADLIGVDDPALLDTRRTWAPRSVRAHLRVPIGVDTTGAPVELDLKESAHDGMGPHGLLIGATGSGKSELLRTLVLGLAATHDSASLNFVLIDFKGGATFASLDRLPHTAAVITNLADELPLVDRMTDALNGELVRRQNLLRQAGNLTSRGDYERARAGGAPLAPMPELLIVCDEFSELLSAKPDFIDLFVAIGRLGRSLGVHLLLASQRLDEGRLRGLDTHLSYRIGLRTFSAMESRAVLGVPDAYELPRAPGHGYLKFGTEPLVRFKAAYVSGRYHAPATGDNPATPTVRRVLPFTSAPLHLPATTSTAPDAAPPAPERTLLDVLVNALHGAGAAAHQVWLPPLAEPPTLDSLLDPLRTDPLRVPVALVDRPYEQRRDPLWLDLGSSAGHVAIVGGPQAGKSSLIRTLLLGLALTHPPRQVTFYCLDFGGGGLGALRELPHVGTVVGRLQADAVRRTVGEMAGILADRERAFAATGIDSAAAMRERIDAGAGPDPYGDVFLVVDGWTSLRTDFDDLEPVITDIAARGLSYGVHMVVTAGQWGDFRPAIRNVFGTRLELRLGDPADSHVSRKDAGGVPEGTPGRGITPDGKHFLAAVPRATDGTTESLVATITQQWPGSGAPAVRELPEIVRYDELALAAAPDGQANTDLTVPIGIAEADLRPVTVDFGVDPHLIVFGDTGCGKSSFLRATARSIIRRYRPEQARIVILDFRRSMLGDIEGEHLIGYATSIDPATALIDSVADYMRRRLPGPDVTPGQLRSRSWWTGPECFVLVDDLDLVGAGAAGPLAALHEYLPQARDVGLHLVVARRTGGASRALFEPVLARLRELATPGLLMSGDRDEAALLGSVRPQTLPPGRALLVNRHDGTRLIQLAYAPPVA